MIRYNYFKKKSLLIIILTLILISMIFTLTAEGLIIFLKAGLGYFGRGEIIYDPRSTIIFSSTVDLTKLENISFVDLVPEVLIPVYICDQFAICRGVDIQKAVNYHIYNISLLSGEYPKAPSEVLIGHKLAERLKVHVGDLVIIRSILRNRYFIVRISGIYHSASPLDYEILAGLDLGRYLRGFDAKHSTIVRVISGTISATAKPTSQQAFPQSKTTPGEVRERIRETIEYELASSKSEEIFLTYLHRFGFSGVSLLLMAILMITLTLIGLHYAVTTFIEENRDILMQLYTLGVSTKRLKIDIILKSICYIILFAILAYIASHYLLIFIWYNIKMEFIIHIYDIGIDINLLIINVIVISLVYLLSIWRGVKMH